MNRRGVSVAIAELIIVSIAIVIAIGVIGWLTGMFSFSIGAAESLRLYPDSYIILDYTNNTTYVVLHVFSNIKPSITIYSIEIDYIKAVNYSIVNVTRGSAYLDSSGRIVLSTGTEAWIRADFAINPHTIKSDIPGKKLVDVISLNGNVYKVYATIKKK